MIRFAVLGCGRIGRMHARNLPDAGACFEFTLPLGEPPPLPDGEPDPRDTDTNDLPIDQHEQ